MIQVMFGSNLIDVAMKRISIYFAAAIALLAASCSKAEFENNNDVQVQRELVPLAITSGEKPGQDPQLKTSLSGNEVHWTEGDCVGVIDKANFVNQFESISINGSSASFEGLVEAGTTDFYAVYPYAAVKSADASNVYVSLPSDQTPAEGTFANNLNISVAQGTRTPGQDEVEGLTFKNVCGLVQFTVPQRLNAVSKVTFTANNRSLSGDLTLAKSDLQTVSSVSNGSDTVTMEGSFAAGSTFYFVVAPGDISGFSITVLTDQGATFSKTSTKTISVTAGAMRNLGVIDFSATPTAEAYHTYDSSDLYTTGILTGTTVKLNLGLPSGMEKHVTKLVAYMRHATTGEEVRYIQKSSANAVETLSPRAGYTYIPQGDYTIAYTFTLNNVETTKVVNVTIPAPQFEVSATATTSYSLYSNGISGANDMNADLIKDIAYSISISDLVLSEINLTACSGSISNSSYTCESVAIGSAGVNPAKGSYYSNVGVTGVPVGEYTVNASATFDGVTAAAPTKTIYVTGLPYKADTMVESHWSLSSWNCQYSNGAIQLGGVSGSGSCTANSRMSFYIPVNIPIRVNTNVTVRALKFALWYQTDFTVSVNGTQIIKQNSDKQDNDGAGKNYNLTGTSTFTPSGSSISMNSSYTAAGPYSKIYNFYILYEY